MAELKQKPNIGGDGFSGGAENVFDELDELLRSISVKVDIGEGADEYDLSGADEHIGEITGDLGAYDARTTYRVYERFRQIQRKRLYGKDQENRISRDCGRI